MKKKTLSFWLVALAVTSIAYARPLSNSTGSKQNNNASGNGHTKPNASSLNTVAQTAAINIVDIGQPIPMPSNDSLTLYLPFDGNVTDASGNGRNGMTFGDPVYTTNRLGQANKAINFDGGDDYVSVPVAGNYFGTGFTINGWVKLAKRRPYARFMQFGAGSTSETIILALNNGAGTLNTPNGTIVNGTTTTANMASSTVGFALNEWAMLTMQVDGNVDGIGRVYLNGVQVAFDESVTYANVVRNFNLIGKSTYGDSIAKGAFDDIRIYRRVLSISEINALHKEGKVLSAYVQSSLLCGGGSTNIIVKNPQNQVTYQLRNGSTIVASATAAVEDSLVLNTGNVTANTTFTLYAVQGTTTQQLTGSYSVSMAPAAALPTIAVSSSNCAKSTLVASAANAVSYVWYKDGVLQSGNGATFAANYSGSYTVKAVTSAGCTSAVSQAVPVTVEGIVDIGQPIPMPATDSLALYLPFDGDVTDASGNGRNGTAFGNPIYTTNRLGQANKAINFDGGDDYVSLPSANYFGKAFTVNAWVKLSERRNYSRLIDFGVGPSNGIIFALNNGAGTLNTPNGTIVNGNVTTGAMASTATGFALNEWAMLTLQVDNNSNGMGKVYLNGVQVAFDESVTYADIARTSNYIAKSNYSDPLSKGVFDDIRIYRRALNISEINALLKEGKVLSAYAQTTAVCGSGSTNIVVKNPQNQVTYQLRNGSTVVASATASVEDSLILSTGNITATSTFDVYAVKGSCSMKLTGASYTIISASAAAPVISTSSGSICGNSTTLSVSNPVEGVTYLWSNNATGSSITITQSGNYTVRTIVGSCTSAVSQAVSISVNSVPSVNVISSATEVCQGQGIVFSATGGSSYLWKKDGVVQAGSDWAYTAYTSGSYTVQAISAAGCTSAVSQAIAITVKPMPATTVSVNGLVLSVTPTPNAIYQWYLNNNPIIGATQATYTAVANGVYMVRITLNGCAAMSFDKMITTVSIKDVIDSQVKVYPNPSAGRVMVETSELSEVSVIVLDQLGRQIQAHTATDNITEINLTRGLYFVQVRSKEGVSIKKIVIE
ncbi:Por secretion system C-terminal sorting domain-containing protein [Flexibacter flexilis DSM 6793]|uniref:Por secretion system C-terminal sorting domain-containing protein n=1 Tax=Flexibacter flexilis DSM 6793 TaxID=927664 RepID=A0A1I1JB31_9BACT|nr:LamG-like jellyroll fold domain-containing protein [Flexibacter flexilis]SFC42640.1 Por secretion system C-terminal sorting domain-containing protein [Flexibacter flexilis DSM 6793]